MSDAWASLATTLADRYTIERLLGQGAMGTVHLAGIDSTTPLNSRAQRASRAVSP